MAEATSRKRNLAPWWALLSAVGALAANVAVFASAPGQSVLPWIGLLFDVAAVVFLFVGLRRAFGQPVVYGGKVLTLVLGIVTLLPVGLPGLASFAARKLPDPSPAPQVGQRAPDFTLPDTSGKYVSLDQLLSATSGSPAPKAVLLIFYRGYW